jgi:hypothetical protein
LSQWERLQIPAGKQRMNTNRISRRGYLKLLGLGAASTAVSDRSLAAAPQGAAGKEDRSNVIWYRQPAVT